jgi:hypothetical protein
MMPSLTDCFVLSSCFLVLSRRSYQSKQKPAVHIMLIRVRHKKIFPIHGLIFSVVAFLLLLLLLLLLLTLKLFKTYGTSPVSQCFIKQ